MLRHKLVPVRKRTGTLSRNPNFSNGLRSSIYEAIARAAREARLGDDGIVHPRSWLIASSSVDWFLLKRSLRGSCLSQWANEHRPFVHETAPVARSSLQPILGAAAFGRCARFPYNWLLSTTYVPDAVT